MNKVIFVQQQVNSKRLLTTAQLTSKETDIIELCCRTREFWWWRHSASIRERNGRRTFERCFRKSKSSKSITNPYNSTIEWCWSERKSRRQKISIRNERHRYKCRWRTIYGWRSCARSWTLFSIIERCSRQILCLRFMFQFKLYLSRLMFNLTRLKIIYLISATIEWITDLQLLVNIIKG